MGKVIKWEDRDRRKRKETDSDVGLREKKNWEVESNIKLVLLELSSISSFLWDGSNTFPADLF